jgi:hypothetical protein
MLVRIQWFAAGAVVGSLGTVYGLYRLRQTQQRVVDPDKLVDSVGGALKTVGRSVRDAWDESREAIDEAEQELRDDYLDRRPRLRSAPA